MNPLIGLGPTAAWATFGVTILQTPPDNRGQLFSQLRNHERRTQQVP
jgi:hypothetical protein